MNTDATSGSLRQSRILQTGQDIHAKRPQSILKRPPEEKPLSRKNRRLSYHPSVLLWDAADNDDQEEMLQLLTSARQKNNRQQTELTVQSNRTSGGVDFVDLDMVNCDGMTLLHLCSFTGRVACVRRLLELGANPNLADNEGWTPLHVAAAAHHVDILKLLLQGGARCSLKTEAGLLGVSAVTADTSVLKLCHKFHKEANSSRQAEEGVRKAGRNGNSKRKPERALQSAPAGCER